MTFSRSNDEEVGVYESWISLIMKYCTIAKFRFRFIDTLTEEIVPRRSLRQGDSILPYLFLFLCGNFFEPAE